MTGGGAPVFAAADWGTTRLRIWLMDERGNVLAERRSDEGMAAAASAGFPATLEKHLAAMGASATLPAVICGMAGARQGWIEAPYVPVPAALDAVIGHAVAAPHDRRMVRILPGLAQATAPDVMRGEETQLLGAASNFASELQLVCLPGTHSKWAEVETGTVKRFSTWMTGELFSLLTTASILRHAVDADAELSPDDPVFLEWLDHGLGEPGDLTSLLFRIRAAGLLHNLSPADATAALSGLLIGSEIASATSRFGIGGGEVVLIGSGALGELYARALQSAGFGGARANAEDAVCAGLLQAARRILAGVEGKAAE